MKYLNLAIAFTLACAGLGILAIPGRTASAPVSNETSDATSDQKSEQGRHIFRFDTFGDQAFWGGSLKLHQAIEGSKFGGVGPGVSPTTALAVGLKVDVDTLPASVIAALKDGKVNLNDPAVTLALLKLNSVVGVKGFFKPDGTLSSVGIQCALCHSTVDNSLTPGIGHRLDGWANRDLNVGQIIALAPNLQPFADLTWRGSSHGPRSSPELGARPLRCRTGSGWQGLSPRRQDIRSPDSTRLWTGWRKPAHLDWIGFCDVLECLCRESGDAWKRQLL